jgi:regulator of sirC expression with transglutaminase-like and TPR domain
VEISEPSPREAFAALAARPDCDLDLAEGALLISAEENPALDPRPHLKQLHRWGNELRRRLDAAGNGGGDLEKLNALRGFLYGEKELRGNREDYYDPRNSFLDAVLERRLGIPLSLAVVLIEVGRRAGIPLVGVGFPGHFLVRHACHPHILLDPFDGGNLLTPCDCTELLRRLTRGRIPFSPQLLQTVGPRQILLRMLNNLCGIYLARGEVERCLSVVERKLLLYPAEAGYLRERGVLRLKLGRCEAGLADLESYLEARPEAHDWDEIAALAERVRERAGVVH